MIENPAAGLLVFDTDSLDFYFFDGTNWVGLYDRSDTLLWVCGIPIKYSGHYYNTVLIGTQCWMAENLNIGTRINGSQIQTQQSPEIIEKYCYNDIEDSCDIHGGLYMWDEMMGYITTEGVQGICPQGWHIPMDAEWCILTVYLDNTVYCYSESWRGTDAGYKMKSTSGWYLEGNGSNSSGFTGLPSGYVQSNGLFSDFSINGVWWTSNEVNSSDAWYWALQYNYNSVDRNFIYKSYSVSMRCLKDE